MQWIYFIQFLKLHFLQTKRNIKKYNGVSKDIVNQNSRLYFFSTLEENHILY